MQYIAFVKNDGRIITHVTGETETCDVNPDTDKPDCMYELQWQLLIIFLMRIGKVTLHCFFALPSANVRFTQCPMRLYTGMNFVKTLVMPLIMEKLKRPLTVAKAKILCRPVPPEGMVFRFCYYIMLLNLHGVFHCKFHSETAAR